MGNKQKIQKRMYGTLKKSAFEKNEKGNLVVRGYYTSDNRDMAEDVITRDATERALPMYRQWGNVRYLHTPKPVGKVRRIGIQDGLEWNEAEIEVIDPEAIFQVENELLTALSVGILVDFKDIDIDEETGGFIINNYTLAEISLVDHPANYDAKLKDIVLDDDARHLALQYGLDGMANHIGGKDMTKKEKDAIVEEEIIETPEAEEELDLSEEAQEVTPEEVVEEVPEEESEEEEVSEEEEEELLQAEDESEEDIEDSEDEAQEEIEDIVTVEDSADAEIEKDVSEEEEIEQEDEEPAQEDLSEAVQEIRESLKSIADALESGKGSEEEQETDDEDALQKELKAIKEQNEKLEARLKELEESTPAKRKGLVEETNLEDLDEEEEDEQVEKQEEVSLRKALEAHFEHKFGK